MSLLLLPIGAYLIGSISSAILVSRLMRLPDPRRNGSRNPGATNVLRLGSKTGAAITLLGDTLKGTVPVLLARGFTDDPTVLALVGAAAFLGHLYPVYFEFKGGKGVATALGVFFGINPWVALATIAIWLAVALILRYSSLAALTASALAPGCIWLIDPQPAYLVLGTFIAILLFWRHRSNIQNLLSGRETKIGQP